MAQALLDVLLKFISYVVSILLSPLNSLLATLIPSTTDAFAKVNSFWSLLSNYSAFALSYLGIDSEVIAICILIYIPIITIPIAAHIFKLVCKWWEVLV